MDEKSRTESFRQIDMNQSIAAQAEAIAKDVVAKGEAAGLEAKAIAELYVAAFIGAAITSVSALASRDKDECVGALNTIVRVAGALGYKFGIGMVPNGDGEKRRDH